MNKKLTAAIAAGILTLSLSATALAASPADQAAKNLNSLGLFQGVGTNSDGTPNYDLTSAPTRAQSITMLVRMLGKEKEAVNGSWEMPFTDVPEWAKPYVGYAYANRLTTGLNDTTFGSSNPVTPSQYLTFVLRALGYESGSDFEWNSAWTLSDKLGFTNGEYHSGTASFSRGNLASVSFDALSAKQKNGDKPLYESLLDSKVFTEEAAQQVGLGLKDSPAADKISLNRSSASVQVGSSVTLTATATPSGTVTWTSSNNSVATVSNGVVRGVAKGSATITATANGKSATCSFTVTAADKTVEVTRVSVSPSSGTLTVGETASLSATVSPSNASDKFLSWTTSDSSVATVSSSGQVTAVGEGTARITAASSNGKSAYATIRVKKAANSSSASSGNFTVPEVGKEYGPFTATAHYSTGRYWYCNQVSSFVVTKCEMSNIGKYKLGVSVQGVTDDTTLGVSLRFFDANNRALGDARLTGRVSPNQPYNVLSEFFVEKNIIESAVRMEIVTTADGSKVTPGISSGNNNPSTPDTGDSNNPSTPDTGDNNNPSTPDTGDNSTSDSSKLEAQAKHVRILSLGKDIAQAEANASKAMKDALGSITPGTSMEVMAADNSYIQRAVSEMNTANRLAQQLMGEIQDDPLYTQAVSYLQKYLDNPCREPKSGESLMNYTGDVISNMKTRANYFSSFTKIVTSISI